jgi:hypothetical protein
LEHLHVHGNAPLPRLPNTGRRLAYFCVSPCVASPSTPSLRPILKYYVCLFAENAYFLTPRIPCSRVNSERWSSTPISRRVATPTPSPAPQFKPGYDLCRDRNRCIMIAHLGVYRISRPFQMAYRKVHNVRTERRQRPQHAIKRSDMAVRNVPFVTVDMRSARRGVSKVSQ